MNRFIGGWVVAELVWSLQRFSLAWCVAGARDCSLVLTCRGRDVAPRTADSGVDRVGLSSSLCLSHAHRPLACSDDCDPAAPVGVFAVRLARLHRGGVLPHPPRAGGLLSLSRLLRDLHARQRDPISLPCGLRIDAAASADFLSWDFKVRPSVVRLCARCPVTGVATSSLRPTAAMLPAPPLLPFRRLQRLSPLTQLGDVAISRADSGVHALLPALPLDRACELTCPRPPESSPRIQRSAPHHGASKLAPCSRSGHPLSPLVLIRRLSTVKLDIAISPFCSAWSAFRDLRVLRRLRVRCVLHQSEEAPDTPMGFAPVWLEKSSGQLRSLRGEFAAVRVSNAFRARVHPTSRSAAAHILQHSVGALTPSLDPRLGCAPLRAPLHRPVDSEESVVRVLGLEALLPWRAPWREVA